MSTFTTGTIDLSQNHVFDSINMTSGDTMTFTGSGGGKIIVLGDMTVASGATITLRNNTNLTIGSVTYDGNTRVLSNDGSITSGTPGSGGQGGDSGSGIGGYGGALDTDGNDGTDATGGSPGDRGTGGAGGIAPGGNGSNGQSEIYGGGGGGGAGGSNGTSTERVHFLVYGNTSIAGTVNGAGVSGTAGGNGGNGGGFTSSPVAYGGDGGGGGAGSGGGHAGSVFVFHEGTFSTSGSTINLDGGLAGSGGTGGNGGTVINGVPGNDGNDGTAGSDGNDGEVEGISVDLADYVSSDVVSGIFSDQFTFSATYSSGEGGTISDLGFVYDTSSNPTTSDTKVSFGSSTGSYNNTQTGLTPEQTYYLRSYVEFDNGSIYYGTEYSFTMSPTFIPQVITIVNVGDMSLNGSVLNYDESVLKYDTLTVYYK